MNPLRFQLSVACSPQRAFDLWARETTRWWPHGHSVSAMAGLDVVFEPRPGGRIFERTPDGDEHDWGEILVWEPPSRLVYLWHLRFDRADATEVELCFAAAEDEARTTVTLEHRGWERLGAKGEERRERNERGWSGVLGRYEALAGA